MKYLDHKYENAMFKFLTTTLEMLNLDELKNLPWVPCNCCGAPILEPSDKYTVSGDTLHKLIYQSPLVTKLNHELFRILNKIERGDVSKLDDEIDEFFTDNDPIDQEIIEKILKQKETNPELFEDDIDDETSETGRKGGDHVH